MEIKDRLKALGKTQRWLIFKLREKGVNAQPPLLSSILSGAYTYPQADRVLKVCDTILTEVENNGG
jgi:hypothetical protein